MYACGDLFLQCFLISGLCLKCLYVYFSLLCVKTLLVGEIFGCYVCNFGLSTKVFSWRFLVVLLNQNRELLLIYSFLVCCCAFWFFTYLVRLVSLMFSRLVLLQFSKSLFFILWSFLLQVYTIVLSWFIEFLVFLFARIKPRCESGMVGFEHFVEVILEIQSLFDLVTG